MKTAARLKGAKEIGREREREKWEDKMSTRTEKMKRESKGGAREFLASVPRPISGRVSSQGVLYMGHNAMGVVMTE